MKFIREQQFPPPSFQTTEKVFENENEYEYETRDWPSMNLIILYY